MTILEAIDTTVQELRVAPQHHDFTQKLSAVVTALGELPDSPARDFTAAEMARLRELADEAIDAVERRIDAGRDDDAVQQRLAGTIYEIRQRMETIERWFSHGGPA